MTLIAQILLIFLAIRLSTGYLADDLLDPSLNHTVNYDNYTTLRVEDCGCQLCIRKCCRNGFYYNYDINSVDGQLISECKKDDSINFSVPVYDMDKKIQDVYDGFSIGLINCTRQKLVEFNLQHRHDSKHYFYIQQDGSLYYPLRNTSNNDTDYCVDTKNGITTYYYCINLVNNVEDENMNTLIKAAGRNIPVLFLVATALIYITIPKRNTHRKALIFHTLTLVFGRMLRESNQYYAIENISICIALGFVILYCLYASLFWMNIMCIDIWLAFSEVYGFRGQLDRENIIFIIMSIYAWGMPGLYLLVKGLFDTCNDTRVGHPKNCFGRVLSSFWFFFGMVATLNVVNTILLIMTTINIRRARREAAVQIGADGSRRTRVDDEKYTIYWNLFCVMGFNPFVFYLQLLSKIFTKVGWLQSPAFINFIYFMFRIYGIVIFVVFVCKKRVWKDIRERYHQITGTLRENESSTSTTLSSKAPSEIVLSDVQLTDFKKLSIEANSPVIAYI